MQSPTNYNQLLIHHLDSHRYAVEIDTKASPNIESVDNDLIRMRKRFFTTQGLIKIKEFSIDAYECRCQDGSISLEVSNVNKTAPQP